MSDTESDIDPSKISDPEYLAALLRNLSKENKALKTAREQDATAISAAQTTAQATQDRIRALESEKVNLENSVQALQAGTSNRRESTGIESVRTTIKTPNLTECSSLNQYFEEVKWW